jgi:cyclopropane-fatty-acyl-phospholipid synthase
MSKSIIEQLSDQGIHGPGSNELATYERHLSRFFEREYKRLKAKSDSLESLGIKTNQGPMMEETEALMEYHYDEPLEFFDSFLDKTYRAYSMAYYGETPEEILNSTVTLEDAQLAKFSLIAKRSIITGNERILNIGCGFGSLETYLLTEYPDLDITGITPSKVQAGYLRDRMKDSDNPLGKGGFSIIQGSFDQIQRHLRQNRKFNLIISIGFMEHAHNIIKILDTIESLLLPGGLSFHHFITSRITIPNFLDPTRSRIGTYFPGGKIWPHDIFPPQGKENTLEGKWFINGLNYWRTLEEWHRRYWAGLEQLYGPIFDTKAIAYWNEYFSLCKVMFAPMHGTFYGNSQYLFRKSL